MNKIDKERKITTQGLAGVVALMVLFSCKQSHQIKAGNEAFSLNDLDYFEKQGANVFVYDR